MHLLIGCSGYYVSLCDAQREPSISSQPSNPPTVSIGPSSAPSISREPSISVMPSNRPSVSSSPSAEPSSAPSISREPSISSMPSMRPSVSSEPSAVPSNIPSISVNPSSLPSISNAPSQEPTISIAPSTVPSISAIPSDSPTNLCHSFDQSPSDSASSKGTKGWVIEFVPNVRLAISNFQLHLAFTSPTNGLFIEIHIKEGVFGADDGYVLLARGNVNGNGIGENTDLSNIMIKENTQILLEKNKKYSLYIWSDESENIRTTNQSNSGGNSDITITNVVRVSPFGRRVTSFGRLESTGTYSGDYKFEGSIEYCLPS